MSIEQTSVIDAIGTNRTSGKVHLTVADHWEWNPEHMLKVQEKLNTYLAFVESGEIYSTYPGAAGRDVVIDIILKHRPDNDAALFLEKVRSITEKVGVALHYGPTSVGTHVTISNQPSISLSLVAGP